MRNFYSVSISGYHIAEAGANPISQLAFTLANGFTIVEYYLARGMKIDDFAPNLSFFFSNGMDPEYAVIGRVARRIWARAMRDRYDGGRAQPDAQVPHPDLGPQPARAEISFNDIRTTLQALYALFDNCNCLHTNAYDEALTTPTEESVRRAVAIQLIINRELGLNKNQNPWQGSFADRIPDRPGGGGGLQGVRVALRARRRARRDGDHVPARQDPGRVAVLRDEASTTASLPIDRRQHLPVRGPTPPTSTRAPQLIRSTEEEKQDQVAAVRAFQARNAERSGRGARSACSRWRPAAATCSPSCMEAVKVCSLGQISHALYEVGGQYRRNM